MEIKKQLTSKPTLYPYTYKQGSIQYTLLTLLSPKIPSPKDTLNSLTAPPTTSTSNSPILLITSRINNPIKTAKLGSYVL